MKKKWLVLWTICLAFLSSICWAVDPNYGGGTGTHDDPYQIWTAGHLCNIRTNANKCFKVMADIDMANTPFTIGYFYDGEFDGNGHVISNLCAGLFGECNSALIKNLTLENISVNSSSSFSGGLILLNYGSTVQNCHVSGVITGSGFVGGLIGYNRASYSSVDDVSKNSYSSIINCSSSCEIRCNSNSSNYVGGLIGLNRQSNILSCSVSGNIIQPMSPVSYQYMGGLIGRNISGQIRNCHFNGTLNSNSGAYTGGIVGLNGTIEYDNFSLPNPPGDKIMYCTASGQISGGDYTGGIAGCQVGARLSHCESTCTVTGGDRIGGLAGCSVYASIIACCSSGEVNGEEYVGGLTGLDWHCDTRESYASGHVAGGGRVGGLTGHSLGTLTNCYAIGSVTGTDSYVGGLVGRTYTALINNCFSSGFVDGTASSQGGFIGSISSTTITSSFWDMETSGQSAGIGEGSSEGILGQTTDAMKTLSTFTAAGWDFDNDDGTPVVWALLPDHYPQFYRQPSGGSSLYAGGDGSIGNPYQIASVADFNELTVHPADWSKHFILTADIDLSGTVLSNSPIAPDRDTLCGGFQGVPFTGSFNGNGHTISNLQIESPESRYIGLFGKIVGATVSNLLLDNAVINGRSRVGVLAGACSYGMIINCGTTGSITGVEYVGGLIGYNIQGFIEASSADCLVAGRSSVGGLVGENGHGTITRCKVSHSITVSEPSGYSYAGGLAGCNTGDIEYSCFTSDLIVDGNEITVGGIAGVNYSGNITSVYTTGNVMSHASSSNTTGGFIGYLAGGSARYSYSTAAVDATGESGSAGGFIGDSVVLPFSTYSCVWDIESSGITYSSGGKPVNTQLMKSVTLFQNAGWNNKGWVIDDGVDFPKLTWENTTGSAIPPAEIPFECIDGGSYQIYTAEEFALLSWYEGILDKNICLMNDLDLSGVALFPIGDLGTFTGRFVGNGHVLYNVKIHQPGSDYIGLFSTNTQIYDDTQIQSYGLIRDVKLVNADIIGNEYVGGIVGANIGGPVMETACSGSVEAIEGTVGGIVGYSRLKRKYTPFAMIDHSYSNATVKGGYEVGGLIGNNELQVFDSYASGPVISESELSGGLFGKNRGYMNMNCFWDIEATGQTNGVGEGWTGELFGKTTADMMTQSTFTDEGWDFVGETANGSADLWRMCTDGVHYPHFWWEYVRRGDFVCGDGVDLNDFAVLANHWQLSVDERNDANDDGVVDLLDLSIVAMYWLQNDQGE